MNFDVVFDTLPGAPVANPFAAAADWEETLELSDMLVQAEDAVSNLDASSQLFGIKCLVMKSSAPASMASR